VELAEALGVHQTNVSEIERGIRGFGVQHLAKISKALHVSPDQLLGLGRANGKRPSGNQKLMRRVRRIEQLPPEHQEAVIKMIDAFFQTRSA
jgi:transcriptional regulator with XRE-family HTH domain